MSKHATEYFQEQQKQFTEWVECPSKFEKKRDYSALTKSPIFKAGSQVEGLFKDDPHTSW